MTIPSRISRIRLDRFILPSRTIQPATVPTLETLKTSSTSTLPVISSLISGDNIPSIAAVTSSIASYIIEYRRMSTPSFSASLRAFSEGLTWNPMIIASDAAARVISDSDICPTALCITFT